MRDVGSSVAHPFCHFSQDTANAPHVYWKRVVLTAKQDLRGAVPQCQHLHRGTAHGRCQGWQSKGSAPRRTPLHPGARKTCLPSARFRSGTVALAATNLDPVIPHLAVCGQHIASEVRARRIPSIPMLFPWHLCMHLPALFRWLYQHLSTHSSGIAQESARPHAVQCSVAGRQVAYAR